VEITLDLFKGLSPSHSSGQSFAPYVEITLDLFKG